VNRNLCNITLFLNWKNPLGKSSQTFFSVIKQTNYLLYMFNFYKKDIFFSFSNYLQIQKNDPFQKKDFFCVAQSFCFSIRYNNFISVVLLLKMIMFAFHFSWEIQLHLFSFCFVLEIF
jgi:hypothetical protein